MASSRGRIFEAVLLASLVVGVQAPDPAGDQLDGATSPAFDLLEVSTEFGPGVLNLTLAFDSADAPDLQYLSGWVDFDTDKKSSTGRVSHIAEFELDPAPELGVDYYVEFVPGTGEANLYGVTGSTEHGEGTYPVTVNGTTVSVSLPRCCTGACQGICISAEFDAAVLIGNLDGPTDRARNDASVIHGVAGLGDFDRDGDVDDADVDQFEACATGPGIPQTSQSCNWAKLDADDDIDQVDFGLFQRLLTGPY